METSRDCPSSDQEVGAYPVFSDGNGLPVGFKRWRALKFISSVPSYVLAQIMGSMLGAYIGKSVYKMPEDFANTKPLQGCRRAFWAELTATFIVMFMASSLTSDPQAIWQFSNIFALGAAIVLAILLIGPVSGGSMNPARSLGPAIISQRFENIWLYLVAPTIGAVAGALLFRLMKRLSQHCSSTSPETTTTPCKQDLLRSIQVKPATSP